MTSIPRMDKSQKLELLRNAIQSYPDFPKPGVEFRDIFGAFRDVVALRAMKDLIVEHVLFLEIDLVVGLDSRGFLFGPMISLELGKPFIPIRKKGKLPGKVIEKDYSLEYSEETIAIQVESIPKGARVLIVDDLLATGGTMNAAIELLESLGANVVECLVIIELNRLKGKEKLNVPVHSFIQYE
ncbi:adenine phosphoribosyltransferase [Megalopta genalis]|uniref:adenine phosphoribosyltransferase n=1 Tax=Megalopta genalis TaxID=115081 RepID=UPI0014433F35|nr:adenine phosphoribosyltransferase [Megalopta genalis]XP_033336412.1 adenine phosphoribosyltransferase [Megalopta genalis]